MSINNDDIFDDDEIMTADADDDLGLSAADLDDEPPSDEDLGLSGGRSARSDADRDDGADYAAVEQEHAQRQAQIQQTADAWASEVEKRKAAIAEAQEAWKKAEQQYETDDIDLDQKLEIQQRLIDARYRLNEAETAYSAAKRQADDEANSMAPAARAWVSANPRFNTDQVFAAQAIAVSRQLESEGFNNTHPRFYAELDRRLRSTPRMGGNQQRSSGGPVIRSGNQRSNSEGPALTPFDRKMMSRFGLNPNDKRHAKQWLGNKQALRSREAARGR
jgi:hypothetical protein